MSAEGHQRAKSRLGTDLTRQVDLALLFILWDGAEVVGPMLGRTKPVLQFRRKFVALAQSAHIVSTVGPAGLDQDVLALDKTGILEGLRRASTPAPGPNRCWQTPPQASLVGVEIFVCISTPSRYPEEMQYV